MKKTIKKKKAFTLVELMGVLVIIGILSVILIPTISNVLKENKEKLYQNQLKTVVLAAKNFGSDNIYILPENEVDIATITLGQLKKAGYLDESIINPKTQLEFSNCLIVEIKKVNNNYEYIIDENSIQAENCSDDLSKIIVISEPTNQFIKKGSSSYYIVTVKSEENNNYVLDESKISLNDSTDSKFSVTGDKGVYKITVLGGEIEGSVSLMLNSGAIKDEYGTDLIGMNGITASEIIVDNTAPSVPTIINPTNEQWSTKDFALTLSSNDNLSGIAYYQYTYNAYATETGADSDVHWVTYDDSAKTNFITTDFVYERNHNVYVRVCDKLGNCSDKNKTLIKLDKTAPTLIVKTYKYNDYGSVLTEATNNDITISDWKNYGYHFKIDTSTDNLSGIVENRWEWNDSGNADLNTQINQEASIVYNGFHTAMTLTGEGYRYGKISLTDEAGNSRTINVYVKIDTTTPTITYNGKCTPYTGYDKCDQFEFEDNFKFPVTIYRSHCYESATASKANGCGTYDGVSYSAQNRLLNYINNTPLPSDNKSTLQNNNNLNSSSVVNGKYRAIINMDTSFGTNATIQYAFKVCDQANNCTSLYTKY